jgi:hypothetical protein
LKMEAAGSFEMLKPHGFMFRLSGRHCTHIFFLCRDLECMELCLYCLIYIYIYIYIYIQDGVPCTLTVIVVSGIFIVPGCHVKTQHCELSQSLMNVVVAVSCITYICLKLECVQQTFGGGVDAYPNVSGYSLFVLCGSQHVHSYQFPCFRCSLCLY